MALILLIFGVLFRYSVFIYNGFCKIIKRYTAIKKEHQINEEIRDKEVRLIGETGEQLGVMSSREALAIAEERELDLVKISPNATPPVCKLINYGKYLFELSKKEKEAKSIVSKIIEAKTAFAAEPMREDFIYTSKTQDVKEEPKNVGN